MSRSEFRTTTRTIRKRDADDRQRMNAHDGMMLKRKRASLRRRHGNPARRRQALIDWIVEVNVRRSVDSVG